MNSFAFDSSSLIIHQNSFFFLAPSFISLFEVEDVSSMMRQRRRIKLCVVVEALLLTALLLLGNVSEAFSFSFAAAPIRRTQYQQRAAFVGSSSLHVSHPRRRQEFNPPRVQQQIPVSRQNKASGPLHLIPISNFRNELSFFSPSTDGRRNTSSCIDENGEYRTTAAATDDDAESSSGAKEQVYQICLAEKDDLPAVARFVVTTFGAEAIQLSRDLTTFEQMLIKPAVTFMNGYSFVATVVEVLAGLNQRLKYRTETGMDVSPPKLQGLSLEKQTEMASKSSLLIVLAKPNPESTWLVDIIASVELKLEISDAKIPFSLFWMDRAERLLGSLVGAPSKNKDNRGGRHASTPGQLQPYLSSLCVDNAHRGKGLGRSLVRCVESIARESWGYSNLYLHVDAENKAAFDLYKSEGYQDVGLRWDPFWAGDSTKIGYFVKNLASTTTTTNSRKEKAKQS
jgi:ribosomal protein S18 acetylase RimI-like enzyme